MKLRMTVADDEKFVYYLIAPNSAFGGWHNCHTNIHFLLVITHVCPCMAIETRAKVADIRRNENLRYYRVAVSVARIASRLSCHCAAHVSYSNAIVYAFCGLRLTEYAFECYIFQCPRSLSMVKANRILLNSQTPLKLLLKFTATFLRCRVYVIYLNIINFSSK